MITNPVYTAKELSEKVFEKPQWLIEPLLTRGGDWLLAGEADSYKSLFLVQMCIHASLGLDYLFLKINEPLRILYINVDDNARLVQKRLQSLTPKGQELNDNFYLVCQPSIEFDQAGQEQVKQWVVDYRPDIVIFDHLTDLVVGGTVDARGMQEYNRIKKWICAQDIGVISLAHLNRTTKETETNKPLRNIGGCKAIISDHSVITIHVAQEASPLNKYEMFEVGFWRNKNMDKKVEGTKYMLEVVSTIIDEGLPTEWTRTFLREV